MNRLLLLIPLLFAGPVLAADWTAYDNSRFGYAIDVPPDFSRDGVEPANGDGASFTSVDGTQSLAVWGGNIVEGSFESSVHAAIGFAKVDGWAISYERVTPSWASFSGWRNGIVLYARSIPLCGDAQYASFWLEYPQRDIATIEPAVDRLVRSLQPAAETC